MLHCTVHTVTIYTVDCIENDTFSALIFLLKIPYLYNLSGAAQYLSSLSCSDIEPKFPIQRMIIYRQSS